MTEQNRFNPDGLILSANYQDTMTRLVLPWLKEREQELTVRGTGDKPLYCSRYAADRPRGTVVLVHGFTENAYKYAELIHSLLQNGYCVCAYDQRGNSRSWRDGDINDLSLTHADDFEEYVTDLQCVLDQAAADMLHPLLAFAHSMGGAVVSLLLERRPDIFAKVALYAPMIAPNRNGIPLGVGLGMCRAAKALGKGKQRIPLSQPYSGP